MPFLPSFGVLNDGAFHQARLKDLLCLVATTDASNTNFNIGQWNASPAVQCVGWASPRRDGLPPPNKCSFFFCLEHSAFIIRQLVPCFIFKYAPGTQEHQHACLCASVCTIDGAGCYLAVFHVWTWKHRRAPKFNQENRKRVSSTSIC